jgi:hypothetical protein
VRAKQQMGDAGGDYDVIIGSRSWRLIMALHRARYQLRSRLMRFGARTR